MVWDSFLPFVRRYTCALQRRTYACVWNGDADLAATQNGLLSPRESALEWSHAPAENSDDMVLPVGGRAGAFGGRRERLVGFRCVI